MAETATTKAETSPKTSSLRLLVLSPAIDSRKSQSPFPSFLHKLTGTQPSPDVNTFAGYTSHPPLYLKTKYYEINVGIWSDELPQSQSQSSHTLQNPPIAGLDTHNDVASADPLQPSASHPDVQGSLSEWQEQMLSEPAREVRDVIGGIIVLLPHTSQPVPSLTSSNQIANWIPYIEAATALRDAIEADTGRDVASIVMLQNTESASNPSSNDQTSPAAEGLRDRLESQCLDSHGIFGWDYVLWNANTATNTDPRDHFEGPVSSTEADISTNRNEFGEKSGFPRLLEVLESTDWTAGPSNLGAEIDKDLIDYSSLDFFDAKPNTNTTKFVYPNKPNSARPVHPSVPGIGVTTTDSDSEHESLLAREQQSFQHELLGLKMAMLELDRGDSGPSSLAGEYDVGDFGARTPMLASRLGRLGLSGGGSRSASYRVEKEQSTGEATREDGNVVGSESTGAGGTGEGDEMEVEQLAALMEQVKAVREQADGMSGPEKEKFARREVNRLMKQL